MTPVSFLNFEMSPQRENIPGGLLGMFPEDDIDLIDKKNVQSDAPAVQTQRKCAGSGKTRSPENKS